MEKRGEEPATLENFRPHFSANMNADFFFFPLQRRMHLITVVPAKKKKMQCPKHTLPYFLIPLL